MDTQQTEEFREKLVKQRELVAAELAAHRLPKDSPESRDPEELAVEATTNLVETRLTEDHENLLRKIDFALERLAEGTYRQCANCGGKIPLERLRAKPSASLCVSCQELKDSAGV